MSTHSDRRSRALSYAACAWWTVAFWTFIVAATYAGTHKDGALFAVLRFAAVVCGLALLVGLVLVAAVTWTDRRTR